MTASGVAISIVSHGQGRLIEALLEDLTRCQGISEVVVTRNLPEPVLKVPAALADRLRFIDNSRPKGFGANHNSAFASTTSAYYCVLNPDVRLPRDPFPLLVAALADPTTVCVAPLVRDAAGNPEDSARDFPHIFELAARKLGRRKPPAAKAHGVVLRPDWVAGMFMLFRSADYRRLGGFDDRFFLYCEDTDLCARVRAAGGDVIVRTDIDIIHDARRASHRKPRYAWWHIRSVARLLWKHRHGWVRAV